jgi:hypothetical protein
MIAILYAVYHYYSDIRYEGSPGEARALRGSRAESCSLTVGIPFRARKDGTFAKSRSGVWRNREALFPLRSLDRLPTPQP